MKSVMQIDGKGKVGDVIKGQALSLSETMALDVRVELIRSLVPIALEAVSEALDQEVVRLAGGRYERKGGQGGLCRWGRQGGSVYLGEQKVSLSVPRVRDVRSSREVSLSTYQRFHEPSRIDESSLMKVLKGLSCRDYEGCAEAVPEAFGVSASSISRRVKRASAKKLCQLSERDLSSYDMVGIFFDGKTFGDDEMVIALGVTLTGEKVVLGFVQTATENEKVCTAFLKGLIDRGLSLESGLLVVIDGAKGLRKAVTNVFSDRAAVQRCQWHKRENIVSYLSKGQQSTFRRKLQAAYERPTYEKAKRALKRIRDELSLLNQSAVASLDEGFEETLTLHRLGVFNVLGRALKTTNAIENVNALVQRRTGKVTCWRNSDQKHRWLATALLDIEPRLHKLAGYHHLPQLRTALQMHLKNVLEKVA
jgi:putative transposase